MGVVWCGAHKSNSKKANVNNQASKASKPKCKNKQSQETKW